MENKTLSKDQLQLAKYQAMSKKKPSKGYFFYIVFILCLAYILDEIATNINLILQNDVIDAYFFQDADLSRYTLITTLCAGSAFFTFFYKALADKFGRKPLLIANCFGIALGLFLCFLSKHIAVHIAGLLLINFFIPSDIQVIYILEISSNKRRAFWLAFTKAIAFMGIALVPVIRSLAGNNGWQLTFLIPAIFGAVVGFVGMFTLRESTAFVQSQIDFYSKKVKYGDAIEDETQLTKEQQQEVAQGGLLHAIKYMINRKELMWMFLIVMIFGMCLVGANNFSVILDPVEGALFTQQETDIIYIVYPFAMALVIILIGLLSDRFGRKIGGMIGGVFCFIGILCYVVACKADWFPVPTGLFLGFFIGGYYSSVDVFNIMTSEQSPTNLRSSILSVISAALAVGSFAATGILVLFEKTVTKLDMGYFTLILTAPPLLVALLLLHSKLPETKNKSLTSNKRFFNNVWEKLKKHVDEKVK